MLQKETKTVSTISRCKDERGEGMKGGEGGTATDDGGEN